MSRALWLTAFFLWVGLNAWAAPDPLADEEEPPPPVEIVSLETALNEEFQQLQLVFKGDYAQSIGYLYDPGVFSAILPHSQFGKELARKRLNNAFVDLIRLRREGKNSILEVRFSDSAFSAAGKVTHEAQFETVTFKFFKERPEASMITGTSPSPLQSKPTEASADAQPAGNLRPKASPALGEMGTDTLIQALAALAVVLALIYGGLWAYNKFFLRKMSFKRGRYRINLASSFYLSPKQRVVVLEVNDMAFACGVTPNQIGVIAQVDKNEFSQFMGHRPQGQEAIDFGGLREEYRQSRTQPEPVVEPSAKPPSFAAELLDKVRKLKPIE